MIISLTLSVRSNTIFENTQILLDSRLLIVDSLTVWLNDCRRGRQVRQVRHVRHVKQLESILRER